MHSIVEFDPVSSYCCLFGLGIDLKDISSLDFICVFLFVVLNVGKVKQRQKQGMPEGVLSDTTRTALGVCEDRRWI